MSDDRTIAGIPPGVTVIEASAGTGKTHRVTSLAVQALADGLPVDSLLLVTFTRAATGELRDRVWQRLVDTESDLHRFLQAGAVPADEVSQRLCDADTDTVARRHHRIGSVVAEFDAATIATIHGFCEQVLSRVGFAGDVERDVEFIEDPRDLTEQVVDDLLVQRFHKKVAFEFPRDAARRIAEAVVTNPHARIVPEADCDDPAAAMRARFAAMVRQRLARRKRELQVLGYDDLLTRLEEALTGPQGDVVRHRLDEEYRLVVVDEFQDTDAVQWNILRDAFVNGAATARHGHVARAGRRSEAGDLRVPGCRRARLPGCPVAGHPHRAADHQLAQRCRLAPGPRRAVRRCHARPPRHRLPVDRGGTHHRAPRLLGGRRTNPLRIRHVRRDTTDAVLTPNSGDLQMDWARAFVAEDLATDIVFQLDPASRATLVDRARTEPRRPGRCDPATSPCWSSATRTPT